MPQARPYQDLQQLAQPLEVDSVATLKQWLASNLVEPYWNEYYNDWLKRAQQMKGKKGGEFSHVVKQLAAGESGGKRRYSSDFPNKASWQGVDYQARLLYKL